ncbi:MAG: FMN-binding protein [Motiliproteus sp.]
MEIIASDRKPGPDSPWPMYQALVGVGIVCALLIVSAFLLTLPAIQQNRAEALERAIFNALPEARIKRAFALMENDHFVTPVPDDYRGEVIYAGFDANHRLVGLAMEAQGMGYQDRIRMLYGYAPDRQAIVGMQVLDSRETPGLGDKIEKDSAFRRNFMQLDVSLNAAGSQVKNPIVAVKSGSKTEPWQVEGITGATVSSKAVARILAADTGRWVPLVQRQLREFDLEGAAHASP